MNNRTGYEESLDRALRKVTEHIPEGLVEKFAWESGITKDDIHPIPKSPSGIVSAVDGSNSMIIEGGSVGVAAIRAVRTTFSGMERSNRSITPITLVTIGPGHRNHDFDELYYECFGIPPHKGLDNADPERASAILRDTLDTGSLSRPQKPCRKAHSCSLTGHCGYPARTTNRSSMILSIMPGNTDFSSLQSQNAPGQPGAAGTRSSPQSGDLLHHSVSTAPGGLRSMNTSLTIPSTTREGTGRSISLRSTRSWHGR